MKYIHLTARAYRVVVPLDEHEVASWLWPRLRHAFPRAVGAILMPNHPHLLAAVEDESAAWLRLVRLLAGLKRSKNAGAQNLWERVPPPEIISGAKHLRRFVRYLALNPTRAGLVNDPLSWPWSTHRDVVGAVADRWVDGPRLARALGLRGPGFERAHHGYVSADPTVAVGGTPFPRSAEPTSFPVRPLSELAAAAASATRSALSAIRRRGPARELFIQLASRHGWRDTRLLASICGMSSRAVRDGQSRSNEAALAAAELCVGDGRLQVWARDGVSRAELPDFGSWGCDRRGIEGRTSQ